MGRMDTQEKLDRLEINYDYLKEENEKLEKENKKLKEQLERMKIDTMYDMKDINSLYEENKKLKEELKNHKLYEEKLEHRIIEFEELLHGD